MGAVGSDFLTSVSVPSLPTSYHPVGKRSVMHADTKREVKWHLAGFSRGH